MRQIPVTRIEVSLKTEALIKRFLNRNLVPEDTTKEILQSKEITIELNQGFVFVRYIGLNNTPCEYSFKDSR